MADLNLVVLSGRLAVDPEVRQFESGSMMVRLLVTTRVESPRTRVDVIPVTYWPELADDPIVSELASATRGSRVWVCGAVQRRFWESPDGRRSRVEVVAESVSLRESEAVMV